jgi:hypothetical protein
MSEAKPDPAAIFGAAESLYRVGEIRAGTRNRDYSYSPLLQDSLVNLSEAYHGGDNFMRECMRVATMFERWACAHVDFERMDEVWTYWLQEDFGDSVYDLQGNVTSLASFKIPDCRKVAVAMGMPLVRRASVPPLMSAQRARTHTPMEDDPPF